MTDEMKRVEEIRKYYEGEVFGTGPTIHFLLSVIDKQKAEIEGLHLRVSALVAHEIEMGTVHLGIVQEKDRMKAALEKIASSYFDHNGPWTREIAREALSD